MGGKSAPSVAADVGSPKRSAAVQHAPPEVGRYQTPPPTLTFPQIHKVSCRENVLYWGAWAGA